MLKDLPIAIERVVRGYCEDYPRRKAEIAKGALPPETIGHYMIINAGIDRAIASCCVDFCEEMREDIAGKSGYQNTKVAYVSCGTYKERKRRCKLAIAKELHLL